MTLSATVRRSLSLQGSKKWSLVRSRGMATEPVGLPGGLPGGPPKPVVFFDFNKGLYGHFIIGTLAWGTIIYKKFLS